MKKITNQIKEFAIEQGFTDCRISKPQELAIEAQYLKTWLQNKHHGQMGYLDNYFDKRIDPELLFEGTKSIISLSLNYFPEKQIREDKTYFISKYAYGNDYHKVIKKKLKHISGFIIEKLPKTQCRSFVDSAPVMEKIWAQKSGLGWMGKNTNIISKKNGSFFFIAEIFVTAKLDYDEPIKDYCGNCTKCIDACPTNAIYEPYKLNAQKCISYLTIELKNSIPLEFKGKYNKWIFGCDICQDVCPWNKKSKPNNIPEFQPEEKLFQLNNKDWEELTEEEFSQLFKKSAVKRAKYSGLKRNISFLKK